MGLSRIGGFSGWMFNAFAGSDPTLACLDRQRRHPSRNREFHNEHGLLYWPSVWDWSFKRPSGRSNTRRVDHWGRVSESAGNCGRANQSCRQLSESPASSRKWSLRPRAPAWPRAGQPQQPIATTCGFVDGCMFQDCIARIVGTKRRHHILDSFSPGKRFQSLDSGKCDWHRVRMLGNLATFP